MAERFEFQEPNIEADPEKLNEKERHVSELLYPTGDRDDLSAFIKKMIYGQATNLEIREEETIKEGFDPGSLEREGQVILEEVERLLKKQETAVLTPEEQLRFKRLYGFTRSIVQEPVQEGQAARTAPFPIRHSALTCGLMFEISKAMRKALKVSLEPDPAKQDEIIMGHEDIKVTALEISEFIRLRNSGTETFRPIRERQEAFIKRTDRKTPAGKSMPKIFTGYLNTEALIE